MYSIYIRLKLYDHPLPLLHKLDSSARLVRGELRSECDVKYPPRVHRTMLRAENDVLPLDSFRRRSSKKLGVGPRTAAQNSEQRVDVRGRRPPDGSLPPSLPRSGPRRWRVLGTGAPRRRTDGPFGKEIFLHSFVPIVGEKRESSGRRIRLRPEDGEESDI